MKRYLLALLLLWPTPTEAQTMLGPGIPNLCAWSTETIDAGQTRTLGPGTVTAGRVCVKGTLRIADKTKLLCDEIFVLPGGAFEIGTLTTPATDVEVIGRNAVIDTTHDPEQYGQGLIAFGDVRIYGDPRTAWARLTADAKAGDTTLAVALPIVKAGDRLALPSTQQGYSSAEIETPTVASVTTSSVTLTAPLQFTHRSSVDLDGIRYFPHVQNLTRSVRFRSEAPTGVRWHVMLVDRANVDIRYASFSDLGRTDWSVPIDNYDSHTNHIGTNQIGRYGGPHMHHLFGPLTPNPDYQFKVIGNAVLNGKKGGYVVHNASDGLLEENICFNVGGSCITTEQGSEMRNRFRRNAGIWMPGTGNDRCDDRKVGEQWHCGDFMWLAEPSTILEDNLGANAAAWLYEYMMIGTETAIVSPAPGQLPTLAANRKAETLRGFRRNEGYASKFGLTTWDLNAYLLDTVYDAGTSTFEDLVLRDLADNYHYSYGEHDVLFLRPVFVGDGSRIGECGNHPWGLWFGDYLSRNIRVQGGKIHNLCIGMVAPIKAGDARDRFGTTPGDFIVDGTSLRNVKDLYVKSPYGVGGGGVNLVARNVLLRNVMFGAPSPGGPDKLRVWMELDTSQPNANFLLPDRVVIETGQSSEQIFYKEQDPAFVIPPTTIAPVSGLTNAAAWAQAKTGIGGGPAPCLTTGADVIGFVCPAGAPPPPPPPQTTVSVNPSQTYQTITGWEALIAGSIEDWDPLTQTQLNAMIDLAVEYGVTRVRLPVRSGWEGPDLFYGTVNDNSDPNVLNDAGFNWTNFDVVMDRMVVPARQRILAAGGTPYILLSYVDFGASAFEHYANPAEYAEYIYAIYRRMQTRYGFVPNGLDVIVEPNDIPGWDADAVGRVITATAARLAAEGFPVPEFVMPSVSNAGATVGYIDGVNAVAGAMARVSEFAYHCYGGQVALPAIADRAVQLGKNTSMTECVTSGNGEAMLRMDLIAGRVSAWAQGIFGDRFGCQFGQIVTFTNGVAELCPTSRLVRQITRYVRPGAVRLGTTSDSTAVAFRNADGRHVAIVSGTGTISVSGLPAGTYERIFSTQSVYDQHLADVTIAATQAIVATLPTDGLVTFVAKGGPPPPPTDTTPPVVGLTLPPSPLHDTITVTATCTDNVACAGVRLQIDGQDYGEDTSAPYSWSVNTLALGNTSHNFTATARDTAGLTSGVTTSGTVDNATPPPPPGTTTLTYLGQTFQKLSEGQNLTPDADPDAGFSVTFPDIRTITQVCLQGVGTWCTAPTANWWLGVALDQNAALLNNASGVVNFSAQSFAVFADDGGNTSRFVNGAVYTVTVTTTTGVLTATHTISSTPPPPPPPDNDGDGIPDASDKCPTQPAPGTADGCPVPTPPDPCTANPITITVFAWPTHTSGTRTRPDYRVTTTGTFTVTFASVPTQRVSVTNSLGCTVVKVR